MREERDRYEDEEWRRNLDRERDRWREEYRERSPHRIESRPSHDRYEESDRGRRTYVDRDRYHESSSSRHEIYESRNSYEDRDRNRSADYSRHEYDYRNRHHESSSSGAERHRSRDEYEYTNNDRNASNKLSPSHRDRAPTAEPEYIKPNPSATNDDLYFYLGLYEDTNPSLAQFKEAYNDACLRHHPDRALHLDEEERKHSAKRMKEITLAKRILIEDEERKQAYDRERIVYDYDFQKWKERKSAAVSYVSGGRR